MPPLCVRPPCPIYGYLSKEYVRSGIGRRNVGCGSQAGFRRRNTERGRFTAGVCGVAAAIPAHDERARLGRARFENSARDFEWIRGTTAERETGSIECAAKGRAARHASERETAATVHSGFSNLQRSGNGRAEDAVRAGQCERLPVGCVPPVVDAFSRKRAGALFSGE